RDWYQNVLGVSPVFDEENYVEFRPGGHSGLCLHPADEKSPQTMGGAVAYWRVTNFNQAVSHFEKHGAKIYRGPLDIGNGESICQMLDPVGNVIGFVGPVLAECAFGLRKFSSIRAEILSTSSAALR